MKNPTFCSKPLFICLVGLFLILGSCSKREEDLTSAPASASAPPSVPASKPTMPHTRLQAAIETFQQLPLPYVHEPAKRPRVVSERISNREFLAQAKLFPWTNYTFFGGEQKFRQMLQRASAVKSAKN